MVTPAKAEAAASLPVFLINSRREVRLSGVSFINDIFWTSVNRCQFKKSGMVAGASRTSADKRLRACTPKLGGISLRFMESLDAILVRIGAMNPLAKF